MINLSSLLDLDDAEAEAFLDGIQGNIIKGHGRAFSAHILVQMVGADRDVRRWIADFTNDHVVSAGAARRGAELWKAAGGPGDPFAMVLLAPDGYRHLGFTDDQLPAPVGGFFAALGREHFRGGMKARPLSDISAWEAPYRHDVHAMILLADNDEARLNRSVIAVLASLEGVFDELVTERGAAITATFPRGELTIEHFGFQDGVSQPVMIKQDLEREIALRGATHWNPQAALALALVPEPGPGGGHGSFMVFRKLEQNVRAFHDALDELARTTGRSRAEVGAMAVGRFEDGTPALPTPSGDPTVDQNDFHYDSDPPGSRCPFHAHIRKSNPRGDIRRLIPGGTDEFERAHRIVRRGITYGTRPDLSGGDPGERPQDGVGLLFMSFQANLHQFVIQQEGADSVDFVKAGVGLDAVTGRGTAPVPQTWPSDGTATFTMANFVKTLGGEYLFAPSMTFLTGLASSAS